MKNLLFVTIAFLMAQAAAGALHCERGALDLSLHQAQKLKPTPLNGEWEFYWGQLLTPADLAQPDNRLPAHVPVPASWSSYVIEGKKLPAHGCATYRLRVKMPETSYDATYGLEIKTIYSNYVLWVNGVITAEVGTVGRTEQASKPAFQSQLLPIVLHGGDTSEQTIELVLQVSNHDHQRCGLHDAITIGSYNKMLNSSRLTHIEYLFFVGILVLIAFNHALNFGWNRSNRAYLYFALACLVITFRNLASVDRLITSLFPNIGWELLFKLDNLSAFCSIPFFCLFFGTLYPKHTPQAVNKVVIGLGAAIALLILATPVDAHGVFHKAFEAYVAVGGVFTLYILLRAVLASEPYAMYSLLGQLALFITALSDVIKNIVLADIPNLSPLGMILLAVLQSAANEKRSAKALAANEQLSQAIQHERDQLEHKVQERTLEMQRQNETLERHQRDEAERNRINTGIATINEIAARHRFSAKKEDDKISDQKISDNNELDIERSEYGGKRYNRMYQKVLKHTITHIDAQIGAIYVANHDNEPPTLDLAAAYGIDKNTQWNNAQMPSDKGLLGETYQFGTTQLLTRVPEGYLNIESATGSAAPRALLIAPLTSDDTVVGAIEIASFNDIGPTEQEFVEKAAAVIAHNVYTITNNERNERLIRDFETRAARARETEERLQECLRDLQHAHEDNQRLRRRLDDAKHEAFLSNLINKNQTSSDPIEKETI